jgi:hypothetical protein
MHMSWESIAAIAAVAQTGVVAVTAAFALFQLHHLRHQNQLTSFMQLLTVYNSPEFDRARVFVITNLKERLRDPVYRAEIEKGVLSGDKHPEALVVIYFQEIGQLLSERVVDAHLIVPFHHRAALLLWQQLLPMIALRRNGVNAQYATGFEALIVLCKGERPEDHVLRYQRKTPRQLKPLWDETKAELARALSELDGGAGLFDPKE